MPLTVVAGLVLLAIVFPIVGGAELLVVSAVVLVGAVGLVVLDRRTKRRLGGAEAETDRLANRPPESA